jgi:hypothetical protein
MPTLKDGSLVAPPAASRPMAARLRAKTRLQDNLGKEALFVDEALAAELEDGEDELPAEHEAPQGDALTFCARLWCVCTKQSFDPESTKKSPEFLEFLQKKGLDTPRITPLFDVDYYSEQLSWQNAPINYYLHYCESALDVALPPHVLFDSDYVLSQSGLRAFDRPPLLYFLEKNDPTLSPHPLFQPELYSAAVGDDFLNGDLPICAFISRWAEKSAPFSSYFSRRFYSLHEPVVRYGGLNPLVHFMSAPPERRRDPNPMFHRGWYANSLASDGPDAQSIRPQRTARRFARPSGAGRSVAAIPVLPGGIDGGLSARR